jgi:hypothetical protein
MSQDTTTTKQLCILKWGEVKQAGKWLNDEVVNLFFKIHESRAATATGCAQPSPPREWIAPRSSPLGTCAGDGEDRVATSRAGVR